MNQIFKIRICPHCFQEIESFSNQFSCHVRWCDKREGNKDTENIKIAINRRHEKTLGKLLNYTVSCFKCKTEFEVEEREFQHPLQERYFCSRSCANSHIRTVESKQKSRETAIVNYKNLSDEEKLRRIQKSTENTPFRSKGEKEVLQILKDLFPDDLWKTGHIFKYQDQFLSTDIVSQRLKVIIEYDGVWHFENIKGQLKGIQNKDRIFDEFILLPETKYRLVRISEKIYHENKQNAIKVLTDTIYNSNEKLVKIY